MVKPFFFVAIQKVDVLGGMDEVWLRWSISGLGHPGLEPCPLSIFCCVFEQDLNLIYILLIVLLLHPGEMLSQLEKKLVCKFKRFLGKDPR